MLVLTDKDVNTKQSEAIYEENNVYLVACPGSGKTRTLAYKIAVELSRLRSTKSFIVAITYTNRAANEIHDRIERLGVDTKNLWIGTIHSFCIEWILKPYGKYEDQLQYGFKIINTHDSEKKIKEICSNTSSPRVNYYDCSYYYDRNGINYICADYKTDTVARVLEDYHQYLRENKLVDFEQILWLSLQLLENNNHISDILSRIFSHILVDEFQDTKDIQYAVLGHIVREGGGEVKAFFVGDPNQSIYTSLGGRAMPLAELQELTGLNFESKELSVNYRSSDRIIDYYSNFKVSLCNNTSGAEDKYYPSVITYDTAVSRDEIIVKIAELIKFNMNNHGIKPEEICVVAPWWIHLASLTRGLINLLPDYEFDGPGLTPFHKDPDNIWYKVARLGLTEPSPSVFVRRVRWANELIKEMSQLGIDLSELSGKKLLRLINEFECEEQEGLDYLREFFSFIADKFCIDLNLFVSLKDDLDAFFQSSAERIARIQSEGIEYAGDIAAFRKAFGRKGGITVSSIHGVKGAEFDAVIVFGLLEGILPHFNDNDKRNTAKRMLYVAGSRARKNLHLISETGRNQDQPTEELTQLEYEYDDMALRVQVIPNTDSQCLLSAGWSNKRKKLMGLMPYEYWLKKIPKGGPYPRGKYFFKKKEGKLTWTQPVWVEVLTPYIGEIYDKTATNDADNLKKYRARVKSFLPQFPDDVIETWLWEHSSQIEEFTNYELNSLVFYERRFNIQELTPIGSERNSPTFLNLRQLKDTQYQKDMSSNKNWPMRRLVDYISKSGTWPRKPVILGTDFCQRKPNINKCAVLSPWHAVEGRRRIAVLIHLSEEVSLKSSHRAWVAVIR